ncbi:MAG: HEAT repeat domain-containing protein [Bdellovibrionota bacterium]
MKINVIQLFAFLSALLFPSRSFADDLQPFSLGTHKFSGGQLTFVWDEQQKYIWVDASSIVAHPSKPLALEVLYFDAKKKLLGDSMRLCVMEGSLGRSTQTGHEPGKDFGPEDTKYFSARLYDCRLSEEVKKGARDLDTLKAALRSDYPLARSSAAAAIQKMGEGGRAALPELLQVLDPEQPDLISNRYAIAAASYALGLLKEPTAVPKLEKLLDKQEIAKDILNSIAAYGPLAKPLIPKLKEISKNEAPPVQAGIQKLIEMIQAN